MRSIWLPAAVLVVLNICPSAVHAAQPNIIFLFADDQRADTLGCMGNKIIQTPHIDKLAERGVTFDNAFVTTAICMINRACCMTGQYAARHGVIDFRTNFTDEQLAQTYPAMLSDAGYRIGFIGKWGVGRPPKDMFDYNKGFAGQGNFNLRYQGKTRHLTSVMGDQAIEFLDGCKKNEPFCLSVSFKAPHVQDTSNVNQQAFPFDPKLKTLYTDVKIPMPETADWSYFNRLPDFLKNSENRARWAVRFWGPQRYQDQVKSYYRLISGIDVTVGRIVEHLAKRGMTENTVIIYSSDHGFYLGEYGFAGKWFAHEVSIRVPLIIADPHMDESQRGTRRDQMALTIDLAPTILALGGVDAPKKMQGANLLPVIKDEGSESRPEFYYEHMFQHRSIPRSEGVRTKKWKYMRYIDSKPLFEEMYDLENDPDEKMNLATSGEHSESLAKLRGKCDRLRESVK